MNQEASDSAPTLVADIGGTNARFGVARMIAGTMTIGQTADYACADFGSLEEVTVTYMQGLQEKPWRAAIAVAGPVVDGTVRMTNLGWDISEPRLASATGIRCVRLVNDFSALAFAAAHLDATGLARLGHDLPMPKTGNIAVLGPGTGFGVTVLVRDDRGASAVASEGGHMGFAPQDELEIEVLRRLQSRFGRVSNERILCGPGMLNLHRALCDIDGGRSEASEPADITSGAQQGDAACLRTVELFCGMLGSVAGDVALVFGASAGVFIAGGIVVKIRPWLESGSFRTRFDAKGRLSPLVQRIPTYIVTEPKASLLGTAWAGQSLRFHQQTAI